MDRAVRRGDRPLCRTHGDQIRPRLLPVALDVLRRHREAGDQVVVATGAPPELARAILAFVAHQDVPVIGTAVGPRWARWGQPSLPQRGEDADAAERGYREIATAYSDSSADLPLLLAAREPVVVNPKAAGGDVPPGIACRHADPQLGLRGPRRQRRTDVPRLERSLRRSRP